MWKRMPAPEFLENAHKDMTFVILKIERIIIVCVHMCGGMSGGGQRITLWSLFSPSASSGFWGLNPGQQACAVSPFACGTIPSAWGGNLNPPSPLELLDSAIGSPVQLLLTRAGEMSVNPGWSCQALAVRVHTLPRL